MSPLLIYGICPCRQMNSYHLLLLLKPSPSFPSLLTDQASVQKEIVDKHNNLRRMTDPPARNMLRMVWNAEAAKNAENWGKMCTLSHSPKEKRRISFAGCGENLFMSSYLSSWSDAIQAFYDEVQDFKYGFGATKEDAVIGHYTQLVWATSHQLGCAVVHCPYQELQYYFVCHYCPPGNFKDTLVTPYKIGKPCEDCPEHCDKGLCTNPCMYEDEYSNCPDLAKNPGCDDENIKKMCQASCKCLTEIK
ncbi:serotriflin-like [Ornithorhynchus anatinus]|uniref:serotriflin-like n=1 Tax=Ornithorhynchus anatinus TaxID=9258 RepID=UPI0019D47D08|nr:serotriflin-like [Ornithorhynchus anatinus]